MRQSADQLPRTTPTWLLIAILWRLSSKFYNVFRHMERKFLEYSFSKSESSTGTKVPWGKSVWNICSRGTKVPQERKFHGAKVFGTFAPEERKFHRGESSMGQKCLEHLLPRNESSTGAKVPCSKSVWNICSRGTKVPRSECFTVVICSQIWVPGPSSNSEIP